MLKNLLLVNYHNTRFVFVFKIYYLHVFEFHVYFKVVVSSELFAIESNPPDLNDLEALDRPAHKVNLDFADSKVELKPDVI